MNDRYKGNSQDPRFIFLIYSLEKYEIEFGKDKLNQLIEQCPFIRKKHLEKGEEEEKSFIQEKVRKLGEDDKLVFILWVMSLDKFARDEILLELFLQDKFYLDLYEKLEREYRDQKAQERISLINMELTRAEIEKVRVAYLAMINSLRSPIQKEIKFLTSAIGLLEKYVMHERKIINVLERAEANGLRKLISDLPVPDLPEGVSDELKQRKQAILNEIDSFMGLESEKRSIPDLLNNIAADVDYLKQHAANPEFNAKFDDKKDTLSTVHHRKEHAKEVGSFITDLKNQKGYLQGKDKELAREYENSGLNTELLNSFRDDIQKGFNAQEYCEKVAAVVDKIKEEAIPIGCSDSEYEQIAEDQAAIQDVTTELSTKVAEKQKEEFQEKSKAREDLKDKKDIVADDLGLDDDAPQPGEEDRSSLPRPGR